jgi:hypothetical protein
MKRRIKTKVKKTVYTGTGIYHATAKTKAGVGRIIRRGDKISTLHLMRPKIKKYKV